MEEETQNKFNQEVAIQAKDLLQEQLSNLSVRLFEVGKKADQQLTTWITFAALTILILFGTSEGIAIGGVKLDPLLAGAVTYILSCIFYYRTILSTTALDYWRRFLKQQRRERFALIYKVVTSSKEQEELADREFDLFVSEYPGYIACSVLVKTEAQKKGTLSGKYITFLYKLIMLSFGISPYLLAACLLYKSWFSWRYIGITIFGLIITLSSNLVLKQDAVI